MARKQDIRARHAFTLRRARRAFTLIEMIVVIAITAVLMTILFIPLSRSLDLSARGFAKSAGMDNTRAATRRVTRDLANAMEVYPPRDLAVWGYDNWTQARNRPRPANGAAPERYLIRNGLLAFRLPNHQYYCTRNDHYVTQTDVDAFYGPGTPYDLVALATCPRTGHDGSPLDLRPRSPLEPERNLTIYFIGLKNPGRQVQNRPLYENLLLFRQGPVQLNTYTLYRASFDPANPNFANYTNVSNGLPNPDFFYDTAPASGGNGLPFWQNWRNVSRDVLNSETADVVRWVETTGGKFLPHSLVSFTPTPIEEEVAQPNRETFLSASGGTSIAETQTGDLAPLEYQVTHGHWLGSPGDGAVPVPLSLLLSNTIPPPFQGPRIQVLSPVAGVLTPVFDSALAAPRDRLVGYDSTTGRVQTAFRRLAQWPPAPANLYAENYQAVIATAPSPTDPTTYRVDLIDDVQTAYPGSVVSSFGSAKTANPLTMIAPGSEYVQELVGGNAIQPLRRAGWTGLGPSQNRVVAQSDLEDDEYSIDYATGRIVLSNRDPNRWADVLNGAAQLLVKYRFQTNRPDDVVRVSYSTRELLTVNLGVVQFTRRNSEQLPFEVSERVVVRNLKR